MCADRLFDDWHRVLFEAQSMVSSIGYKDKQRVKTKQNKRWEREMFEHEVFGLQKKGKAV